MRTEGRHVCDGPLYAGNSSVAKRCCSTNLVRLSDSRYPNVNIRKLEPGGVIGDTGLGKIENPLKYSYSFRSSRPVNAVSGDSGECGVIAGNAV